MCWTTHLQDRANSLTSKASLQTLSQATVVGLPLQLSYIPTQTKTHPTQQSNPRICLRSTPIRPKCTYLSPQSHRKGTDTSPGSKRSRSGICKPRSHISPRSYPSKQPASRNKTVFSVSRSGRHTTAVINTPPSEGPTSSSITTAAG